MSDEDIERYEDARQEFGLNQKRKIYSCGIERSCGSTDCSSCFPGNKSCTDDDEEIEEEIFNEDDEE